MIDLKLESWSAMAPGIEDIDAWRFWFSNKNDQGRDEIAPPKLKQISPMLRRRFTTLGKYAATVALAEMAEDNMLPTIYASRHGDTPLTLSLLLDIGRGDDLSPTSFSLAVHNAVGGLLSIARKDVSPMTAIASTENLLLATLHEALAQLTSYEKVLCVVYDVPLPDIYNAYADSLPFPVALAFVLSRHDAEGISLNLEPSGVPDNMVSSEQCLLDFIAFLLGDMQQISLTTKAQQWTLARSNNV